MDDGCEQNERRNELTDKIAARQPTGKTTMSFDLVGRQVSRTVLSRARDKTNDSKGKTKTKTATVKIYCLETRQCFETPVLAKYR